ncbi:outer membrane beta-barrel protein [Duganella sp. FT50W]|uniref:Outer membrane beta-barrel protein n=1 Tax=Duganella lactea TaxID=2692173 RepID=A0A6L8MPF9_9BURK|nr:XrtB/PEP-CTERM-associated polysaccharide biosynthesis outer membrane protein EpsL [Duganella lactea]MYM83996.1 outer membrane beta-barrel protein [Duganella lactea]
MAAWALASGAVLAPPAHAAFSDTVKPFVALGYTHDDNLLRLEDGQQLDGGRADNIRQSQAGVSVEWPLGRQVLVGSAKVSKVSFDHFSQLDYTGQDYQGTWNWVVGNHLNGHLGASYAQTIAPFTDFHSNERNLKTQKRGFADIFWRFHPSWQVHAGYVNDQYDYDLASQRFNTRTEKASDAGVDFLATSGSTVGLVARRLNGHYPYANQSGPVVRESGYTQDELKLKVLWRASGLTEVQFLGGRVKRRHDLGAERDVSGTNARLTVQWTPRERLRWSAAVWREFTAVESSILNYALSKGGSVNATWDLSAKVALTASARRERRDFNGLLASVLPISYDDDSRTLGAGVSYAPTRTSQLSLQYNRETRDPSNRLFSSGYRANSVSFNASLQF